MYLDFFVIQLTLAHEECGNYRKTKNSNAIALLLFFDTNIVQFQFNFKNTVFELYNN